MATHPRTSPLRRRAFARPPLALIAALALAALPAAAAGAQPATAAPSASARSAVAETAPVPARPLVAATLEECVTAVGQAERSATFGGEMIAIPGGPRMSMRVDVLERLPAETAFHAISSAGLGLWRAAAPGVKVFKNLNRVTNLSAPAFYRAAVRFRWLNSRGRVIRTAERRTPICQQPEPPPAPVTPNATGG